MSEDPEMQERDESTEADVVERFAADEAFGVLGNETRLRTLQCLFDADEPLTFSDLREGVGMRDSGQFNYHLDKLLGTFARVTEDGYELTAAGTQVAGAILAGEYTKTIRADPVDVGANCSYCEGPLVSYFAEERVRISCGGCGRDLISLSMPPGALEAYPQEKWPKVAERWTRTQFEMAMAGFCPTCRGPIEERVTLEPESLSELFEAGVVYACERCSLELSANAASGVLTHPAVVGFHHEHGIDVDRTAIWELEWPVSPTADVVSEDPIRVEIPIELDGDRLVLVIDGSATVVEERRE